MNRSSAVALLGAKVLALSHLDRASVLSFLSAPAASTSPGTSVKPEVARSCLEKTTNGGKPAGYQILRKLAAETTFSIIANASSKATEKVMTGQPLNNNMQFRVVALNDAGESLPSNTVEVKL